MILIYLQFVYIFYYSFHSLYIYFILQGNIIPLKEFWIIEKIGMIIYIFKKSFVGERQSGILFRHFEEINNK